MIGTTAENPGHLSIDGAGESVFTRIESIDIFRGITLAVMIFVNDLDGTKGLPWWTFHAKANWDVMTYVDMVFPVFLFLVGMSMPIAIAARLRRNPSLPALWGHVLLRSASLIILGLILANGGKADPTRMLISPRLWEFLGVLGCSLFLSVYPGRTNPTWHKALRVVGALLVITVYALFRNRDGGWIDGSYPEILGLIGYGYFAVCVLYIPFRRWLVAPLLWCASLAAFNAATAARWITFDRRLPAYLWPWGNGSSALLIMSGVVTTIIFLQVKRFRTMRYKGLAGLAFALHALFVGFLLKPLGISKIRATPTWCLFTIAFAAAAFTFLYWLCDVKKKTKWAFAFRPAGSNTLTTYLLPDYWEMLPAVGMAFYGWQGVAKSLLFTCFILAVAALLTKSKVRLAL